MERRQPKRKAWHIVLEIGLSVLFFGVCMLAWLYFRPTVLKTVFADALPSAVPTQDPFETPNAVAFAAYEDERILFAEGTPIPTPVPTPTPSPEPTPVPTKNPASGDTLYGSPESAFLFEWYSIDVDIDNGDSLFHILEIDDKAYDVGTLLQVKQSGFNAGEHKFRVIVRDLYGDSDTLAYKNFHVIDTLGAK